MFFKIYNFIRFIAKKSPKSHYLGLII